MRLLTRFTGSLCTEFKIVRKQFSSSVLFFHHEVPLHGFRERLAIAAPQARPPLQRHGVHHPPLPRSGRVPRRFTVVCSATAAAEASEAAPMERFRLDNLGLETNSWPRRATELYAVTMEAKQVKACRVKHAKSPNRL